MYVYFDYIAYYSAVQIFSDLHLLICELTKYAHNQKIGKPYNIKVLESK
jgi:hypothetical protein